MNKHNTNTESEFNDNDFLKTEGKYRKLIDNAPLGMLIIKKGEIIVVNKALVKNLGYEKDEEIVGKKIMDFIAPEFKEIAKSRLSQLNSKEGEVVDNLEEKLIKKDGSLIDAIVVGHSLQLEGELVIQGYIYDVTERKKVENELVESEKRFREVFLTSPDSININRLSDGLYINVNEGFLKITGYTFEEVLGKTSKEINIWQNIKERDKLVALLEKNGSVLNFESKFRMKDGTVLDGLMSSSITSINGEPHIISVTRNISQLKLAQNKLKESEERLRIMFEHANAVMILINPETGKIVDANKTACDFYGYTHEKITSDITIYDINTNTSREAHDAMCHSVLDENKRFFLKHKLSDGTIRDVELYVGKIVLHGQVLLFAVIHDITERLKVELENQKLSKAVMQSPASLIITDTNGKIEFVNKMFTEISGYSWDEAIGKNPRILKSGKMPNHVYEKMWKKISSGKVWNGELLNKKKDGTLYWENVTISPITNSEGEIINLLGVKEDITEAKKNKLILTEAKEKAEQSDKLKSEFLAQMSHEIRTPVNSILSFSNLLKQDFFNEDNEDLSLIFNSIDSASKRIIRTIEMIINMAEIQSGSYDVCFKEINFVEKILDPLIEEYKMIAELRGLKLIFESDANSKKNIVLDEYSATQIFTNLLDNAIKYTVKGFIKVAAKWDSDSRLNVEVSDSGIGMSAEYLNKLFLPFTQEEQGYSRKFDGNGLGLALVKNYCELNGASIEVKSKKNLGSTFIIKFKK